MWSLHSTQCFFFSLTPQSCSILQHCRFTDISHTILCFMCTQRKSYIYKQSKESSSMLGKMKTMNSTFGFWMLQPWTDQLSSGDCTNSGTRFHLFPNQHWKVFWKLCKMKVCQNSYPPRIWGKPTVPYSTSAANQALCCSSSLWQPLKETSNQYCSPICLVGSKGPIPWVEASTICYARPWKSTASYTC